MSRTKLGYFKPPLSTVERDLIWEHYAPHRDKIHQIDIYMRIKTVIDCLDIHFRFDPSVVVDEINDKVNQFIKSSDLIYRSKDFTIPGLFAYEVIEIRKQLFFQPTKAMVELSEGLYEFKDPLKTPTHTPPGLSYFQYKEYASQEDKLIEFANAHFDLFKLPGLDQEYGLNQLLHDYLVDFHRRSELKNPVNLDHTDIINQLTKGNIPCPRLTSKN